MNETVCVDLKPVSTILQEDSRKQIVYMVDSFSSFTAAGISDSKEAEKVADVILKKWCLSGIGYPGRSWFCDNGSEFRKEHLEEIARKTGRKIELTRSHSPWSNGQCERRHAVIDMTVKKLMEEDPDLKLEDALAHAIWAKNMEIGRHGLSPYQIVYGKSPFLPGISEGTPVSDGVVSDADVIRKHFERQELARSTIRRLDSSRRIKDALKARVQDYHDQDYETGDRIIFEDENGQWKGPAVVQGKESKTLWIVQNGNMRKVAICKARHWEDEPEQIEDSDESNDEPTDDEEIIVISEEVDDTDIESESIEKTKDVDDKQESSTKLEKSDDE